MASAAAPFRSFASARAFTIGVTAAVWGAVTGVLGLVFGGLLARPDVSDGALRAGLVLLGAFAALLAAHGVVNGMTEAYALGRIPAPEGRRPDAAEASPADPWRSGTLATVVVGLPVGLLAACVAEGPVSSGTFASLAFATGACAAAIAAVWASGGPVARGIAAVRSGARWEGSPAAYRIVRHVFPQGLINGIVAALAGLAMPQPLPAGEVLKDAVIATFVIGAAASFGARDLARSDARRGYFLAGSDGPTRLVQLGLCAALAAPPGLVAWAVGPVSATAFVVTKGLWSASLAAGLAYVAAGWGASEGTKQS